MNKPYFLKPMPESECPSILTEPRKEESRNVRLVGHSDLNGWGDAFQIRVKDGICYIAGAGLYGSYGLTVLDVADPSNPTVIHQIKHPPTARSHKVLLVDDVLIMNVDKKPGADDPDVKGGLRLYDNSNPREPKFMKYVETEGNGIHRPVYDPHRKLLYSGGFKDGCNGRVLIVHDMKDPSNPELIGEGWVPGQNEAAGETPTWDMELLSKKSMDLHEAQPFGNYVTCAWRRGGFGIMDLTDPTKPSLMWRQNPYETHNWSPASHTFIVPEGSAFGILLTETHSNNCAHPPAFATFYDMRNDQKPISISTFNPYPIDPITMRPKDGSWCQQGARYGAHNTWQWMKADDPLYLTWFNAGVRIVDWSNPFEPKELGYYIPAGTKERFCPQTNEVFVDRQTGLIYITDRWGLGLHILEYTG
ncbi:hypothetical protein [Mesorhizobium sp. YR577]|uniref:LVIVD repeat-containing protein n=1 Tax=Mesorhizobium sp. YR577 TaxID=1884373 RepID=UPI0008E3153E|nr:hypothetical protein [Mesorhizobium sp. YR577]SFT47667.1 Uncharacterized conserved protein [Mesorhizobium sp. YR577]